MMIACISPSYFCYEETINTLKYADRARNIKKKTKRNIWEVEGHINQYKEIIGTLKEEIDTLKDQLKRTAASSQSESQTSQNPIFITKIQQMIDLDKQNIRSKNVNAQLTTMPINHRSNTIFSFPDQDVLSVDSNAKARTMSLSDSYALEIEEKLREIAREKENLKEEIKVTEEKVMNNDISVCYAETAFIDKIREELMVNLEEEWDVTNSIAEIKELERENNEMILQLANELEDLVE